ncbi:hypothetical protein U1Q18_022201, partial [Sarracenia purpurea var. burkii]
KSKRGTTLNSFGRVFGAIESAREGIWFVPGEFASNQSSGGISEDSVQPARGFLLRDQGSTVGISQEISGIVLEEQVQQRN